MRQNTGLRFGLLFIVLLIIARRLELISLFFAPHQIEKTPKESSPEYALKFCYPEGVAAIPAEGKAQLLLSPKVSEYLDETRGILALDKIGLILDDQCLTLPSTESAKLIKGINSILAKKRRLLIGENHEAYFALSKPAGDNLINHILNHISGNFIFFGESPSEYVKDFSIIPLDDDLSYHMVLCRAADLLPYIFYLNQLVPESLHRLNVHLTHLLFYGDPSAWKLVEKLEMSVDESKLFKKIMKIVKNIKKYSLKEVGNYVETTLFPFLKQQTAIINLLVKLIYPIAFKLETLHIQKKQHQHLDILKNYKNELRIFIASKSKNKDSLSHFHQKTVELLSNYRNLFWVERIHNYLDEYAKEHSGELPYVIIQAGHNHLPGLEQLLNQTEYQPAPHMEL